MIVYLTYRTERVILFEKYTHRYHRNIRLLAQMFCHLLHYGIEDGGDGGTGDLLRGVVNQAGGGCSGGVDGEGHHLLHHIPHKVVEPRRHVNGGASLVRGVHHGGDDGDGVILPHPS